MQEIQLGYIHMSSYFSKSSSLFPDYWLEDEEYREENKKEIDECKEDEIILPKNGEWTLKIDYPLKNPFKTKIKTNETGLTRREIVNKIVKCYKQIYKEERESTKVKVGNIPGMYNRNETNGKYGIWGHDLGDLILHTLTIKGNVLEVDCDS